MELHDHPLYGKRKKRKPACANPLFLQWLSEWREEAAEKGWKTQYVYGKAIKSLKNYPLPLATGKDCKMLEHFGDKTCKLIDEKLAEHIELHGCVVPPDPVEVPRKAPAKQKKANQSVSVSSTRPVDVSRPKPGLTAAATGPINLTDDDLTVTPPPKRHARPRSKSGEQEYVPAYRSGAYAIMLALYRDTQDTIQGTCTPGKHTRRLSTQKDIQSKKKKALTTIRDVSLKKQLRLEFKTNGELCLEKRDLTRTKDNVNATHSTELCLEKRDLTGTKDNVKATSNCPSESTQAIPTTDVYFDLETTGLGRTSSITQMAAVRGKERFSCFVMPKKRVTREASQVTGIRVFKKKMYRYGKFVKTVSLNDAFIQLFAFLSKTQNNILIGHNIQTYDCPLLMHALMSCDKGMTERFKAHVSGFLDTKKLFRIIHPSQKSYTQESLVESLLGEKYKAHDALQDVVALQRLVRSIDVEKEARQKACFSIKDVMDSYNYSLQVKQNLPSLQTMVNKKVISTNVAKSIAGSGMTYSHLQSEHDDKGREGIESVFTATTDSNRDPRSRGYLSKVDLVTKAQPLADKSFTIPDAGCRYTSWASMGTLIKKALVIKESNPARYSITDAGSELAHRLEMAGTEGQGPTTPDPTHASVPTDRLSLGSPQRLTDQYTRQDTGVRSGLEFVYIDDAGEPVQTKDKAQVLIDEDFGIGFLVHCTYHGLLTSGKHYKLDMSRPMGDKVYAHLHDSDAPDRAVEYAAPPRLPSLPLSDGEDGDGDNCLVSLGPRSLPSFDDETRQASSTASESSVPDTATTDSSNGKKVKTKPRSKPNKPSSVKLSAAASQPLLPSLIDRLPTCLPCSSKEAFPSDQDSQESIRSISSMSSVASLPKPDFILTPGSFDIILCIDNQEFYGAGKNGSKTLLPDLMKNGVNCDLRKLQVGDILWVAKERTDPVLGRGNQGRELVLDYVVERKRMDDLVHSCIDGRLPDQKFRLKHCGIRNAIFLIEMYGSMQHFSIAEDRIKQTITNLQIIDGFQIKRTGNTKDSVLYLTTMTRYITSYYRNKTLYATSPDDLQGKGHIDDAEQRLLTFDQFNQGSVKSKALTVREMFGKQLIQLNGMSAEKAKAVTDKYPTPSHVLEAYENCGSVKDKESLLSNIKSGKAMRNLGQILSKQIYQLYSTKQALT